LAVDPFGLVLLAVLVQLATYLEQLALIWAWIRPDSSKGAIMEPNLDYSVDICGSICPILGLN
jgi:hypothetical protein